MPTGTGKSFVIRLLIERFKLRTLVVVPSLEIKRQMTETLAGLPNVEIHNIDSLLSKNRTDFDMLIIDEAHHTAAKTYQKLNKKAWVNIYYRFFLTATPFRNDNEETLLFESIAGEVIYKLNYRDAISRGYIVPVDAYYIETPKQATEAYTYAQVYSQLVVRNAIRNGILATIIRNLKDSGVSTLILVKEIVHGELLSTLTGVPFVNGEDEYSRRYIADFNSKALGCLIGTIGVMGEGVDSRPCEVVVIAGLGKARSQFMQQVGRAVRRYEGKESAKVILIQDKSHKFLTRHFRAQCAILFEEYGIKPTKLEE